MSEILKQKLQSLSGSSDAESAYLRILNHPTERYDPLRLFRNHLKFEPWDLWRHFLFPHSEEYFSKLLPSFCQQLVDRDTVKDFSPVVIRDGLLSLAWFFYKNPIPKQASSQGPYFLVHDRLAPFVPEAWSERVGTYRLTPHPDLLKNPPEPRELYLMISGLGERQASLSFIREKVRSLQVDVEKTQVYVVGITRPFAPDGFEEAEAVQTTFAQAILETQRQLGNSVQYLNWSQISKRALWGSRFLDLNEMNFYYSDSAVVQHLMRLGSLPLESEARVPDLWIPASLVHGYAITLDPQVPTSVRNRVTQRLSFLKSDGYLTEEQAHQSNPKGPYISGGKFCPPSFELLVHSIGTEILL